MKMRTFASFRDLHTFGLSRVHNREGTLKDARQGRKGRHESALTMSSGGTGIGGFVSDRAVGLAVAGTIGFAGEAVGPSNSSLNCPHRTHLYLRVHQSKGGAQLRDQKSPTQAPL